MLNTCLPLLDDLASAQLALDPVRYGLVTACDGGLLEVTGLNAPVGALCEVSHGLAPLLAEVIGFRNGRTLLMLLGAHLDVRNAVFVVFPAFGAEPQFLVASPKSTPTG